MALFGALIGDLSKKFNLGGKAAPLVTESVRLMTNEQSGGLAGFIDRFKRAGMEDLVSSWIGKGQNQPISADQVQSAVGSSFLDNLGKRVGLSGSSLTAPLAFLIPKVIDFLTPNGSIPTTLPTEVRTMLSAPTSTPAAAKPSGGVTKYWWVLA
ncbi:MAG: DUF937 domain-containing protein, partial [Rhodospirillales bacterium]|nr:DUF937 domain-containing protein [Rhodospirillales bacterium]